MLAFVKAQEAQEASGEPEKEVDTFEAAATVVSDLTDDTFKSFIAKEERVFVMFYAPW